MEKEQKSFVEELIDSLFQEATEFEKFEVSEADPAVAGKETEVDASKLWEDCWEDEAVSDEFSLQLKKELVSNANKS